MSANAFDCIEFLCFINMKSSTWFAVVAFSLIIFTVLAAKLNDSRIGRATAIFSRHMNLIVSVEMIDLHRCKLLISTNFIIHSLLPDCLHLQLYRDSKDRYKHGQTKASLSLQHFLGVESGFTLDKESNTIAILCQDIIVVLAFDTRERLIQWQVSTTGPNRPNHS